MTRRLFVAAWPDDVAREEAVAVRDRLRDSGAAVRWVRGGNLHVTLHFLGDVAAERTAELAELLRRSAADRPSFPWSLQGLGTFPPRGRPRVVWIGLGRGARETAALASWLERPLTEAGFLRPSDRPFRPHVTLGRMREDRSAGSRGIDRLQEWLGELEFSGTVRPLTEVRLVESRLTRAGAIYEPVARLPLDGGTGRSGEQPDST